MDADGSNRLQLDLGLEMMRLADPTLWVVFDMAQVEFMASAGLRVCLAVLKRLPEGHFRITQCSPLVQEILDRSGLDGLRSGN
jgi:anti-anti-sigma factor